MKFTKFVTSLKCSGTIYERDNGERWLSDRASSVLMKIPANIKSVTAEDIMAMPANMEKALTETHLPAALVQAIMPKANAKIKDCIRIYRIIGDDEALCPISNDNWNLIEPSDIIKIRRIKKGNINLLAVYQYPDNPDDPDELVGLIAPVALPKGEKK